MGDVIPLDGIPRHDPDQAVIDLLRNLLDRAERGEIFGIVYGLVTAEGITPCWAGGAEGCEMIAAASLLQHRLLTMIEQAE